MSKRKRFKPGQIYSNPKTRVHMSIVEVFSHAASGVQKLVTYVIAVGDLEKPEEVEADASMDAPSIVREIIKKQNLTEVKKS